MALFPDGKLTFALNGEKIELNACDVDPTTTLNDFIRASGFSGTKIGCGEGGCGACTVLISQPDPEDASKVIHRSGNSCLRLLASVDGASVTTTEGIGSKCSGFHPVQKRIAEHNGSQCGFCTPGMVMAMYAGLHAGAGNSAQELENRLDGNLCRCTGYRPLLAAAKSLCADGGTGLGGGLDSDTPSALSQDDLDLPFPAELNSHQTEAATFVGSGRSFVRCGTVEEAISILTQHGDKARAVAGNTSTGIYKDVPQTVLVDVSRIPELRTKAVSDTGVSVGAAVSITDLESLLRQTAAENEVAAASFAPLADHLLKIAGWHVRNMASVAGNLCIAKKHGFLSDLATVLLGAGAKVTIASPDGEATLTLDEFFASAALESNQLLTTVTVPFAANVFSGEASGEGTFFFRTFRTALRAQMCHAYANAAFLVRVDGDHIKDARLAFGGVAGHAIRAPELEAWMAGKSVCLETATAAYHTADKLVPTETGEYAASLVRSFVFKFLIALQGHVAGELPVPLESCMQTMGGWSNSGAGTSRRILSSAKQTFDYADTHAPVSDPVRKIGADLQASGEAVYTGDIPDLTGTLHGSLALSSHAKADFVLQLQRCLAMPGVKRVVTSADVSFNSCSGAGPFLDEAVLADGSVDHTGQPIAVVLADTARHADAAAKVLEHDVQYTDHGDACVTLAEAMAVPERKFPDAALFMGCTANRGDFDAEIGNAQFTVTGELEMKEQKHFYMEPNVVYSQPDEDGCYTVNTTTQYAGGTQSAIAKVLGVSMSHVEVKNRRIGGAFGGKLTRNIPVACATAAASKAAGKPVKVQVNRNTDMKMTGGRHGILLKYTAGYDESGKITALKMDWHCDAGHSPDLTFFFAFALARSSDECYYVPNMSVKVHAYNTNTASRTAARGPGEIQATVGMETVLEHVAAALNQPGMAVRQANLYPEDQPELWVDLSGSPFTAYTVPRMWNTVMSNFSEKQAAVDEFNATNAFVKRGISATTVKYGVAQQSTQASVGIYADGSIICAHGGAEMGQGLNTKVMQVASYTLGTLTGGSLPLSLLRNADVNTLTLPKIGMTGGSVGSENSAEAIRLACLELIDRIKASDNEGVKKALEAAATTEDPTAAWTAVVGAADGAGVSLHSSTCWATGQQNYHNWGVAVTEVEVDVLTGETSILSTQMEYDCGKSLNPAVDIGQAEGAFIMGVGTLLRENPLQDEAGVLVSDGTWEYKIPSSIDIPLEFTVNFLQKSDFEAGILSSKAVGEPPLVLSTSVFTALRAAIRASREERGIEGMFQMNVPCTPEDIATLCEARPNVGNLWKDGHISMFPHDKVKDSRVYLSYK